MSENKTLIKILMLSPGLSMGGMERQLLLLIRSLQSSNIFIDIALFRKTAEYPIPSNTRIIDLKKRGKVDMLFFLRLFRLILKGNYDILHSKIDGPNEYLMLIAGILRKSNIIIESRNSGEIMRKAYYNIRIYFKLFKSQKWKIVCNSMKSVNEIKQILPNHERIFYIGNGIDTQRFRKINYQKENTNIIIGFVGRKEPTKNLKVLIYALHNVLKIKRNTKKTISLKLIGPHPNHSYLSELISLVNQLGLNDNVEFIDKIQRIEEVYNILDLFILPSFVEGTSNSLLEAMACEKICLVSEGADSDNILEKRFVFKNEDVSELSQKIEIFLQLSPEENRTIGENNRRKVVQNFSIDMLLRKYTELWSQS